MAGRLFEGIPARASGDSCGLGGISAAGETAPDVVAVAMGRRDSVAPDDAGALSGTDLPAVQSVRAAEGWAAASKTDCSGGAGRDSWSGHLCCRYLAPHDKAECIRH